MSGNLFYIKAGRKDDGKRRHSFRGFCFFPMRLELGFANTVATERVEESCYSAS